MKLILFTVSIFVLGCAATPSTSVEDQLQRMHLEVDQLKRSNEESIAALKRTYDEKIRTYDEKIRTYDEKIQTCDEKIASLEQQLRSGRMLVPQSVEFLVAFSARLTADTNINDNPVVFGTVDLNIGDGYDEFTGAFRPPYNGVYQLTFYGLLAGSANGGAYMKQNDNVLCQGYLREESYTATCTAIAELTTDDSVRVTGDSGFPSALRGDFWSGFTGFLIYYN